MKKTKYAITTLAVALLSACTATTSLQSKDSGLTLKINDEWMLYKPTTAEIENAKNYFGE